jgi:hypothetical protein
MIITFQIWVQCPHNSSGYYTIYGDDSSYQDHFSARLVTGNTGEVYARTGYLGFLRRTEAIGSDGGSWSIHSFPRIFQPLIVYFIQLCLKEADTFECSSLYYKHITIVKDTYRVIYNCNMLIIQL